MVYTNFVCVCVCVLQGYYRRASANMALGKFRKALTDYEAVKKVSESTAVNLLHSPLSPCSMCLPPSLLSPSSFSPSLSLSRRDPETLML